MLQTFRVSAKQVASNTVLIATPPAAQQLQDDNLHYDHSAAQRTEFLKAILLNEDVADLDAIIAHSSGGYIAAALAAESDTNVKSMALLHPVSNELPPPIFPLWLTKSYVKLWRQELAKNFMLKYGHGRSIHLAVRHPIACFDRLEGIVEGTQTHLNTDRQRYLTQMQQAVSAKTPLLIAFSENDPIVTQSVTKKFLGLLNVDANACKYFDRKGKLSADNSKELSAANNVRLIKFERGGHGAFAKFAPLLCAELDAILDRLSESERQAAKHVN